VITWYLKPWCMPGEVMTDMYYPIYAQGLYESLMQVGEPGGGGGARAAPLHPTRLHSRVVCKPRRGMAH